MAKNNIETPPEVRAYMSQIAKIMTPEVRAARQANAAKAAAARRHESACTCPPSRSWPSDRNMSDPLAHASSCRIYQAEKARRRRATNNS